MAISKVTVKTIQFKRGPIEKLPEEALYGEPILVYDKEENYYLYMGLGAGKRPVQITGKLSESEIDEETINRLISEKLESYIKDTEFEELETDNKKIIQAINEVKRKVGTSSGSGSTNVTYNPTTKDLAVIGSSVNYDPITKDLTI